MKAGDEGVTFKPCPLSKTKLAGFTIVVPVVMSYVVPLVDRFVSFVKFDPEKVVFAVTGKNMY